MAHSSMSFMDALRVAAKAKDAPTHDWVPRQPWPAQLHDSTFVPSFLPTPAHKKRKGAPCAPLLQPRKPLVSSSQTSSTGSAKLLVLPNLDVVSPMPRIRSDVALPQPATSEASESDLPLLRASTLPAPFRAARLDFSLTEVESSDPPHARTATCGSAADAAARAAFRGETPEWVRAAVMSSLRGEPAVEEFDAWARRQALMAPELGRAVRMLRNKLTQDKHQAQQQKVSPGLPPRQSQSQHQQQHRHHHQQQQHNHQQQHIYQQQDCRKDTPVLGEGNGQRKMSLPEIIQWEADVVASAGQPSCLTVAASGRSFPHFASLSPDVCTASAEESFTSAAAPVAGGAAESDGPSFPAAHGSSSADVSAADRLRLDQILTAFNQRTAGGARVERLMGGVRVKEEQVTTCEQPQQLAQLPQMQQQQQQQQPSLHLFLSHPQSTHQHQQQPPWSPAPIAAVTAPLAGDGGTRKRPAPPPPLVDVTSFACAAMDMYMGDGEAEKGGEAEAVADDGSQALIPPSAGAASYHAAVAGEVTGATAAAAPAAGAGAYGPFSLPCLTPSAFGSNQWESAFPLEPPTPSGLPRTPTTPAGGFASLWSEAWADGFSVDLAGVAAGATMW